MHVDIPYEYTCLFAVLAYSLGGEGTVGGSVSPSGVGQYIMKYVLCLCIPGHCVQVSVRQ